MLAIATAGIAQEYFMLPIASGDPLYRERVYCYELYHQLRCIGKLLPYSLAGEVDKSGQPNFRNSNLATAKPDFLVHIPGRMDHNLACVEVKSRANGTVGFVDDLVKLTSFCRTAEYRRGIFLIYGHALRDASTSGYLASQLRGLSANRNDIDLNLIDVWHHAKYQQQAIKIIGARP